MHTRFVLPPIHFIPEPLTYSAPLYLKRQCDRTPGSCPRQWTDKCGVCDFDPSNDCEKAPKDCAGAATTGVAATAQSAFDQCSVCITPGVNEGKKDACLDCGGVPYGPNKADKCGVCDDMAYNDCMPDCTGIYPTDNVQPAGSMAAGQVRMP